MVPSSAGGDGPRELGGSSPGSSPPKMDCIDKFERLLTEMDVQWIVLQTLAGHGEEAIAVVYLDATVLIRFATTSPRFIGLDEYLSPRPEGLTSDSCGVWPTVQSPTALCCRRHRCYCRGQLHSMDHQSRIQSRCQQANDLLDTQRSLHQMSPNSWLRSSQRGYRHAVIQVLGPLTITSDITPSNPLRSRS